MNTQMRAGGVLAPVVALIMALSGPALAEDPAPSAPATPATVVATVNGVEITLGQMIAVRENLPEQYLALPDEVLFQGILQQLLQQELLSQSRSEPSARDEANLANDRRAYLSGVVIRDISSVAVTDEALQAAYDEEYASAPPEKEYDAAHILVDSEEKALELKQKLDEGADFAELAKTDSLDTGSAAQGGDLGWFGLGMMVKPFEEAVVGAEVGKVVGPVKTDFGWHLILVRETRDAPVPALDEVRDQLANDLAARAVEARINELTGTSQIEKPGESLDPALLKNGNLID